VTARLWFAFLSGHLAWSGHLVIGYYLAAQACTGNDTALWALRTLLTMAAVVFTLVGAAIAWAEQRRPGDRPVVSERRFLAYVALTLSGLFLFAIVLSSSAGLVLPPCV
jgi:hypothetical protein